MTITLIGENPKQIRLLHQRHCWILEKCASSKFPKNGKQNKTLIHQFVTHFCYFIKFNWRFKFRINQLIKPLKQHKHTHTRVIINQSINVDDDEDDELQWLLEIEIFDWMITHHYQLQQQQKKIDKKKNATDTLVFWIINWYLLWRCDIHFFLLWVAATVDEVDIKKSINH